MKRVAVVGCRPPPSCSEEDFSIYDAIAMDVKRFVRILPPDTIILSGGANGVDSFAADAVTRPQRLVEYRPEYPHDRCGCSECKEAPKKRNALIVRDCDELHAWPAPWSRGTWHILRLAKKSGKQAIIHDPVNCL